MQLQRNSIYFIRITSDLIILSVVFIFCTLLFSVSDNTEISLKEYYLLVSLIISWLFTANNIGLYDEFRSRNFSFEIISLLKAVVVQAVTAIIIIFLIKNIALSRIFVLYYSLLLILFLSLEKYLFRQFFIYLRRKGRNLRTILMVGAGDVGKQCYETIKSSPHFGYRLLGFLDDDQKLFLNGKYLGKISELDKILGTREIDNVIIALPNYARKLKRWLGFVKSILLV